MTENNDLTINIKEEVKSSEYVSLTSRHDNKITGFSESEQEQCRASSADQLTADKQKFSIQGVPHQGEENSLSVCRKLVEKWNDVNNENWGEPIDYQVEKVDCRVESISHPGRVAMIQVTRIPDNPKFWKQLAKEGFEKPIEGEITTNELLEWIMESIKKKVNDIEEYRRNKITLAIDATRIPGAGFDAVIERFQKQYGPWVIAQKFSTVWLVSQTTELTKRLDTEEPM